MSTRFTVILILSLIAAGPALAGPDADVKEPASLVASKHDWPSWSGPDRNLTSLGNGVFDRDSFGLERVWTRPLGSAYSGIVVVGDRLVTGFSDGESDFLAALDAASGEERWRYRIADAYLGHDGSDDGPVGTRRCMKARSTGSVPGVSCSPSPSPTARSAGPTSSTRNSAPASPNTASRPPRWCSATCWWCIPAATRAARSRPSTARAASCAGRPATTWWATSRRWRSRSMATSRSSRSPTSTSWASSRLPARCSGSTSTPPASTTALPSRYRSATARCSSPTGRSRRSSGW